MLRPLILFIILIYVDQQSWAQTNPLLSSFESYQKLKSESPFHLKVKSVGPVVNSARAEAVQIDPNKPGTIYLAFGSGNLWKTINNGLSWKPIFDNQASHGIGDIALAPSNPDIIYVGTGESLRKRRNFTLPGTGIYKSMDGGESWMHVGLENSWHIGEIVVHPTDPDIVFVAVMGKFWSTSKEKGIYKTINGGKTWKQVLYVDENTRANDIVISQSNPDVLYASMWENNQSENLMESVYGSNSAVYKSIDQGETWIKASNGLPDGPRTGRIGIAVSHQNENKLYANVDNLNKKRTEAPEIYQSMDGGASWQRTHKEELQFSSVIGWYFSDIYVNPKNDDDVYALGVRLMRSTNGGKDFKMIAGNIRHLNPSAADQFHLDQCELLINPHNPNNIFACNDGGLYQSYDSGQNWVHYNNIPTGEFYDITIDQEKDYLIYGGTQDDATAYGPPKEYNSKFDDPWKYLWVDAWSGGDGCVTLLDQEDKNTVYFSMQNGAARRMDILQDTSKSIKPRFKKGDERTTAFNFITPYILSPHDHKAIYHAGNYVFKSLDQGDSWNAISPDLSKSEIPTKTSIAAGAIAESKLLKGLLYVGTDHGAFWYSKDDGTNWQEASQNIANGYIRSIMPSGHNTNTVYMSMTGLNYDDLNSYVYRSIDNGVNWIPINSNLASEPVNVILEDPFDENILYVGTHRGVYISLDKGNNWNLFNENLPAVPVSDLSINEVNKELVIATHGRGIYVQDISNIYDIINRKLLENKDDSKLILFQPKSIVAPKRNNSHKDIDEHSFEKLDLFYWSDKKEETTIKILNGENETIYHSELSTEEGLNQFRWDLVLKQQTSNAPYFIHYNKYVEPGEYKIQLSQSTNSVEKSIVIGRSSTGN